jgi:hypothetical protein
MSQVVQAMVAWRFLLVANQCGTTTVVQTFKEDGRQRHEKTSTTSPNKGTFTTIALHE